MQYNIRMSLKKSILLSFVLALAPFLSYAQTTLDGPKNDIKVTILSLGSGSSRFTSSQWALMAECGYQLVLGWFDFDIYTGLGPSFGTGNADNYFHSFMLYPVEGHVAFTAGFRVGVAF